jgi:DNA-binding NarL/FixJ family response regulator
MNFAGILPSIVLCDDHELFLNGIADVLRKSEVFLVEKVFTRSFDCLRYLNYSEPDILITDLNIDTNDGFDIVKDVKIRNLKTRVVILSAYEEPFLVEKARKMGACAYLSKTISSTELIDALENAESSKFVTNLSGKSQMNSFENLDTQFIGKFRLSKKEIEIIKLVLEGKTSPEIGETLFISKHTAETHRRNIYKKLGISGFVSLQNFSRVHGIV